MSLEYVLSSSMLLAVLSFLLIARIFKFPRNIWNTFGILQVLLTRSELRTNHLREKIIWYCMLLLSVTFLADLNLTVNNIKFSSLVKDFDTWEKIERSGLQVYKNAQDFPWIRVEGYKTDSSLLKLSRRSIDSDLLNCSLEFWKQNRICMGSIDKFFLAKFLALRYSYAFKQSQIEEILRGNMIVSIANSLALRDYLSTDSF